LLTGWMQTSRRAPGRSRFGVFWWDFWRFLTEKVVMLGFGLRVRGRENVPRTGPVLYLGNHQSFLDPILSATAARDRPFRPFARETLFQGPLGWLFTSLGGLPVSGTGSDKSVMRIALTELAEGRSVLIYPEGSRSPDGPIQPFKTGVGLLLRRSEAAIVPVGMDGSFDAWPRQHSTPHWRHAIELEIGEPMNREELLADGIPTAMLRLEERVDELRRRCRARLRERFGPDYPAPGPADGITPLRDDSAEGDVEAGDR
jgi:1-acyl-sn-glycerol-3-phosphate acyltransferase